MTTVTRRSFLQSMSAAFSAAVIGIRPAFAEPPKINYSLFCDNWLGSSRYDIADPFSIDGGIYATDSRVLITHPGEWSGNATGSLPNVGKLQWDEFNKPGWKELPSQKLELQDDPWHYGGQCHHCMATGRVGNGITRVIGQDEDGDAEYQWAGGQVCGYCNGTGMDDSYRHLEPLGSALFAPGYTNRLRTLGGLDCRVIECEAGKFCGGGMAHILLVRGDHGVRGMLMSCDPRA